MQLSRRDYNGSELAGAEFYQKMFSTAMRDATSDDGDAVLWWNQPDTTMFEPGLYSSVMARVAANWSARALQYSPTEGMAAATACLVEVMAAEGVAVKSEHVLITTGGQQVFDLVCKALIDPGDAVVAEGPTYPGALIAFRAYQAHVTQLEVDCNGMPVERLEHAIDALEREGRRVKLVYTIPTFNNPSGVTMSLPRRKALVALARKRGFVVLEDNPFGLLRYEGAALPTLYSLDAAVSSSDGAECVIYQGTLSKMLAPGLRLGWVVAASPILEKLNLGKQSTDLCSSAMTQLFVAALFEKRWWQEHVKRLKASYRVKRDATTRALAKHLGRKARWIAIEGGLFTWVVVPSEYDTAVEPGCRGLRFMPGIAGYADSRRGSSAFALNFASAPLASIDGDVARIGRALDDAVTMEYGDRLSALAVGVK